MIENVGSMKSHKHFAIIQAMFKWAKFTIRWNPTLELDEVVPQKRDRMILIATDDCDRTLQGHACDLWPTTMKPTLKSFGALMDLDEFWQQAAKLDDDETRMYLDPKLLPKGSFASVQVKRSRGDVMKYRLRTPDDIAACFMTTYGNPRCMDLELLQRGGLYGALLLEGDSIRKFTIPEIACLQVPLAEFWLPSDERAAIKALGNAIATPHAAIGLLNALHFVNHPNIDCPVKDVFQKLFSGRMKASNMLVEHADGGFRFSFKCETLSIPSTLPMRSFACITVKSPTFEYKLCCESGISVLKIIEYLTGPSVPAFVALQVGKTHDLATSIDHVYCMPDSSICIRTNVPSELHLCEKAFEEQMSFSPAIVILNQGSIHCIVKRPNMTCQDVVDVLTCDGITVADNPGLCKLNGDMWVSEQKVPDVAFLGQFSDEESSHAWILTGCQIHQQGPVFTMNLQDEGIASLLTFLQTYGIIRDVKSLGWHLVSEWGIDGNNHAKCVVLSQVPGALSVSQNDIREFMMARIFKIIIQSWALRNDHDRTVLVTLKAWNTEVWKGKIRAGQTCIPFVNLWNRTMRVFGFSTEPRFVCCGKQMNPEWPILSFAEHLGPSHSSITIHLVKAVHGGTRTESEYSTIQSSHDDDLTSLPSEGMRFERDVSTMVDEWLDIQHDYGHFPISLSWFDDHHVLVQEQAIVLEGFTHRALPIMKAIHKTGIEATLYSFGWHMVLKFLSFDPPIKVRMIIEPMNFWQRGDTERVVAFILSTLFIAALPHPVNYPHGAVRLSLKLWQSWVVQALYPGDMRLAVVDEVWHKVSTFMARQSNIRLISRGKSASIDFPIGDFARVGSDGSLSAKFILVLPLQGGGREQKGNKSEGAIATKNSLAAFLLSLGCDLQSVSSFVQKILDAVGPVAIDQIMKLQQVRMKHEALEKLAKSMSISFPDVNTAASKRINQVKKKIHEKGILPTQIQPELFTIKDDFFCNEDKSKCCQIAHIRAGNTGVALVTPETASQWLKCDAKISTDELAVITLGQCPGSSFSPCQKIQFPVFDKEGNPAVLAGCIHQLGQKKVHIADSKTCDVVVADTCVIAITIHRQELEGFTWDQVVKSPCRVCFELMAKQIAEVTCPCQPWGRSWQKGDSRAKPENAWTFQCHIRIPNDRLHDLMSISGSCGLYSTPKTSDHQVDKAFSVIWDDRSLNELQVLAASIPLALGIVVSNRAGGKKISRGIRCKRSDYQDVFKIIKPGAEIPSTLVINHVARLAPTPLRASAEAVASFLDKMSWLARPMKPLGGECWLIGATAKFDDVFGLWNQQVVMVSWLPPKNEHARNRIVMASAKPIQALVHPEEGDSLQVNDPWSQYKPVLASGNHGGPNAPKPDARQPGPTRVIEGPIEQKFQAQGQQINSLQTQVEQISRQLEEHTKDQENMQHHVKEEFSKVRDETSKSLRDMQKGFDDSLQKALQNQDLQLSRNFSELKNLILQKPVPQKKAKMNPPSGHKKDDDDDEEM